MKVIREFRPHVIVTYDENGGYPHPDHIRTHVISMAAWEAAGDPARFPEAGAPWQPLKLYYGHGFSKARLEAFHDAIVESGQESPYAEWLENWTSDRPDPGTRVTTKVPCSDWFGRRDDALRAHATQIDPNSRFFFTPLEVQARVWPTEDYELVHSPGRHRDPGGRPVRRHPRRGRRGAPPRRLTARAPRVAWPPARPAAPDGAGDPGTGVRRRVAVQVENVTAVVNQVVTGLLVPMQDRPRPPGSCPSSATRRRPGWRSCCSCCSRRSSSSAT